MTGDERPMPEIDSGPGKRCGWYGPGHEVHWIQNRKSREEPGLVEEGVVIPAEAGFVTVRVGSEVRRYRHHDTETLRETLRDWGERVVIQERWSLLKVRGPEGFFCFSIARTDRPFSHCPGPVRRRGRSRRAGRRGGTGRRRA